MTMPRLKVLLVEDNPDFAALIRQTLGDVRNTPFEVEWTDRLSSGLKRLETGGIDAVLLDLALPDSQGLDTVLRMRQGSPDIPILVLTAGYDETIAVNAIRAGAQDALMKGEVDGTLLSRIIPYVVERRRTEHAVQESNRSLEEALQGLKAAQQHLIQQERLSPIGQMTAEYVTKRRRAEQEVQESNRRLEEALKELKAAQGHLIQQERLSALGQMASGIAHDFNNALSTILGFTEMLLMCPEKMDNKEKVQRYLDLINSAAQDAAVLVRRVREFYRQRQTTEAFQAVDLNLLIQRTIALTQPRWKDQALADNKTIEIKTELGRLNPIAGNESELREVLVNVLFNAIDAITADGTILVRTRTETDHAVLEISDTGAGMSPDVLRRCLEPFFTTKGENGSGLGLAIVYGIIRRHEGTIGMDSEPGRGTTVSIRLPWWKEQASSTRTQTSNHTSNGSAKGAHPAASNGSAASQPPAHTRRLHVLLVEDDALVRETLVEYLSAEGHMVTSANNGPEGLAKFNAGWFDVVLTDRAMPEMNGAYLAAAIKRKVPNKPVILLTGFSDITDTSTQCPEGVDLIVEKPVTRATLREALDKVVPASTDASDPATN